LFNGPKGCAGRNAVGYNDNFGPPEVLIFDLDNIVFIGLNFLDKPVDIPFVSLGVHGRVSALIMGESSDVNAVPISGRNHRGDIAFAILGAIPVNAEYIRLDFPFVNQRSVDDFNLFCRGYDHLFGHMTHLGIGHHQDG